MSRASDLRAKAEALLEQAAALESVEAEFAALPRVRVVCGPCKGRGFFMRGTDIMDMTEQPCNACDGKGWHPMLGHTGMVDEKYGELGQFDLVTVGWDV